MPDNSPYKRTADELMHILQNKDVVKEGEYDCSIKSNREHSTIRFHTATKQTNEHDDKQEAGSEER